MKNRSWVRYILIAADILWVAFIFARSLKAADESTAESAWVLELVRIIIPSASMHFVRKLAHFTEYFILGALLFATMQSFGAKKLAMVLAPAGCLAAAVTDELLQTLSRDFGVTVVVITHNSAIKPIADRTISVKSGRIEATELNANPVDIDEIEW